MEINEFPVSVQHEPFGCQTLSYIQILTPVGHVRMTGEEAEDLGRRLLTAAEYDLTEGCVDPYVTLLSREITPLRLHAIRWLARQLMVSPDDRIWGVSQTIEQLCTGVITADQAFAQVEV